MSAIISCNEVIASILINLGADVNIQNNDGITALMFACSQGFLYITNKLIDFGANIHLTNCNGETALDNAIQQRNYDVIILLRSYDA